MRRSRRNDNFVIHDFYCLNCGKKGISLPRAGKHLNMEKLHRKRLYCPWCKMECNHIECRTYEEHMKFINNFNEGKYIEEAQESIKVYIKRKEMFCYA